MIYYGIEYYDRIEFKTIRYLNNTCFSTEEKAIDEIRRLKKADSKNKYFYGFIRRIRYKVVEVRGQKKLN
jgi:hypothetical protein